MEKNTSKHTKPNQRTYEKKTFETNVLHVIATNDARPCIPFAQLSVRIIIINAKFAFIQFFPKEKLYVKKIHLKKGNINCVNLHDNIYCKLDHDKRIFYKHEK